MQISEKKFVELKYQLRVGSEEGAVVEEINDENPLKFVFGEGRLLPKFEENLSGLVKGNNFSFKLDSNDAYGPSSDQNVMDLSIDMFKNQEGVVDKNMVAVGKELNMYDNTGRAHRGKVLEMTEQNVKMDFNHPLAGMDLFFVGEVLNVREATDADMAPSCDSCSSSGSCGDSCGDSGSCGC